MDDLGELAKAIEKLRTDVLFGEDVGLHPDLSVGLSLDAEQYLLLCLAALDQAQRFATLANYKRMQGT